MPFDFYCMNCGRKQNQNTVLFDLQYLLTNSSGKKLDYLKFRVTPAEFNQLIKSGTPGADGYTHCVLTFRQVMKYISAPNNMDDPVIAELTIEDIRQYLGNDSLAAASSRQEEKTASRSVFDAFGGNEQDDSEEFFSAFGEEEAAEEKPEEIEEIKEVKKSAAILALEAKDDANKDIVFSAIGMEADLKILRTLFEGKGRIEFDIKLIEETDNNNEKLVTGYQVMPGLFVDETGEPRVCPHCGYPVFRHAGTAQHKCVAFFGTQKSGKTSLLVAMTHYALNGLQVNLGSEIWKDAKRITQIRTIELLNRRMRDRQDNADSTTLYRNAMLFRDLDKFERGIAPAKTDANQGKQAYSATFRVQDKFGKFHLLTLTDLPGELIDDNGNVNKEKVVTEFPTALACDAYLICFDTRGEGRAQERINATLRAADTIQKLQADEHGTDKHVPMIIVYTKCEDLESMEEMDDPREGARGGNMIARAHMFCGERQRINENEAYRFIGEQFNHYKYLQDAYKARLRCAAFGYPAPSQDDIDRNPELKESLRIPRPCHIDHLMRWLLSISGCIPVEGGYRATEKENQEWQEADNFITRQQFRQDKPLKGREEKEALARCILFENPGNLDVETVQAHGSSTAKIRNRFVSMFRKN